jgi:6-phosphogluconate dehydrogenase
MKIGYVGLGKMGFNMVERLLEKEHEVFVFDKNEESVRNISIKGALPVSSLESLTLSLAPPRLIWVMVPYQAVYDVLQGLLPFLQKGDTVIDGGNSPYKESMRRFQELNEEGINFLDVGVSGGPSGARNGSCIMVGGKKEIFRKYKNLFRDLACKGGYAFIGGPGSGHYVKMVHNGIEYGMMQALAEGFTVMKASPFAFDLTKIAKLYNHKSVIESRLVGWLQKAFDQYGENLDDISETVSHSGEGSWTVETARELGISVPVIEGSLTFRIQSRAHPSYTGQILSAVRNQFGWHEVSRKIS